MGKTVCLDPGHGPGCVNGSSDGSYKEHEFAWDMARRVRALLEERGVGVVLTRTEEGYPSLTERAGISNRAGADLFLSLHSNAAGNGGWYKASGLLAYTSAAGAEAPRNLAAGAILARLSAAGVALRGSGLAHNGYAVLVKTTAPAVLMEYGFHTSRTDVPLLQSAAHRDRLALATAQGVCDFLGVPWTAGDAPEPWYEADRAWAVANRLTDGSRPGDPCTRAEVWAMLRRCLDQ